VNPSCSSSRDNVLETIESQRVFVEVIREFCNVETEVYGKLAEVEVAAKE
jgi:hypothetical protein